MKRFYLLLLVLTIGSAKGQFDGKQNGPEDKPGKASQLPPPGQRKVNIKAEQISLGDLFTIIWRQVKMHACFREKILDPKITINANFDNTPLESVLNRILSKRGLKWKYYEETFVIFEEGDSEDNSPQGSKKRLQIPPGRRKINLRADRIHLADIFRSIGEQAGMFAVYEVAMLDPDTAIKVSFNNAPLDTVLALTLGKRGFRWKYDDKVFCIIAEETGKGKSEGAKKASIPAGASVMKGKRETIAPTSSRNRLSGRDTEDEILLRQPKVSDVRFFEQKISSNLDFEDIGMPPASYPLKKKYPISLTPLKAERWENKSHLPICAQYYYTPGDSIIRLITYDWLRFYESKYSDNQKQELQDEEKRILEEEDRKIEFYKSEFRRIKDLTTKKLGPPKIAGLDELLWDTPKFHATLKLTFKPYIHFIRLKVYWK